MKITVCIPIYNYYAYPLVRRLVNQAKGLKTEIDVICIDDHSSGYYENQNKGILEIARYLRLGENVGRARIRNLFLKYADGDYLLFLDDDSVVPDSFLKTYIKHISNDTQVIVGGRKYDKTGDDQEHRLRYLYGSKVESQSASVRKQHPYRSFMTNNFLIRRDVFEKVHFDERISKYGHEDTLFGYALEQNKVNLVHIDNAVVNGNVETNVEFLHKTVEAVENLAEIYDRMWEDQRFCQSVRLLRAYGNVRRTGMVKLVYTLFKIFKSPMESHFVNGNGISLKQFSFYKLGIFIQKVHYSNT